MRRLFLASVVLALASCAAKPAGRVNAADYDAFWLWAGVTPQPELKRARSIYLLAGEVRRESGVFVSLRPTAPRLTVPELWLVVRVDTLDWPTNTTIRILREMSRWRAAGNNLAGVQIDFDARTRHLGKYAQFLRDFRDALPRSYRLSVTGLMDWSANADTAQLRTLASLIDEVVVQTYQGRQTIPGYERYFGRISRIGIPFKIGLVQGGQWQAPAALKNAASFRGYVVFLINP